jgi:hypothetical protein
MTRAVREAKKYAEFRNAFGLMIGQFPLVAVQLNKIDHMAKEQQPELSNCIGIFWRWKED